ncbi:hypothetical protein FACS1894105_03100 [Clostridia bacterium]|nr:hypothetical protein FACS1894105_03100 [Clostridia bacterium]
MELCKGFVQAFSEFVENCHADDTDFVKYSAKLASHYRREGILKDAQSIAPMSIADFDRNKLLFNCSNGTLNLQNFTLQPFNPEDFITKLSGARYDTKIQFQRWERFIDEIMCGDTDTAVYLQKALGYSLTGLTEYECFYILFGATTRNGKSTLIDAVTNVLGDYACTIQPQTLSRRSSDGAAASPDMARLKGARLVNMPEPEKGLELNIALIKQMTGGDRLTVRAMYEAPTEMYSEFKPFINTNHLPRTSDDTQALRLWSNFHHQRESENYPFRAAFHRSGAGHRAEKGVPLPQGQERDSELACRRVQALVRGRFRRAGARDSGDCGVPTGSGRNRRVPLRLHNRA